MSRDVVTRWGGACIKDIPDGIAGKALDVSVWR